MYKGFGEAGEESLSIKEQRNHIAVTHRHYTASYILTLVFFSFLSFFAFLHPHFSLSTSTSFFFLLGERMYSRHARLLALVGGLAFALAAPAPQDTPSWSTSQCTTHEITDASIDQTKRWNSVDTEAAWKAAMDDWQQKQGGGLTFTQEVSNFFNGPEQMMCGALSARDGCGSYVQCNNVNHPAGMFILNSFAAISSLNYDIFDAISKAEGQITTDIGGFATTFAPIDDAPEALKVTLDLLGLGFALVASPLWNSGMSCMLILLQHLFD